MNHPHPASVILLGLAVLLAASLRQGIEILLGATGLAVLVLLVAPARMSQLVRRSRWLLLTMLVMFGWLTPGTPFPNLPGATGEGLLLAADNIARLLVALSIVALMLNALSPPQLVAGIRSLMIPLSLLRISRDRIAVRLALTLEEVESSRHSAGGDADEFASTLSIPAHTVGLSDAALGSIAFGLVLAACLA